MDIFNFYKVRQNDQSFKYNVNNSGQNYEFIISRDIIFIK
jgi:hypothetical protein